MIFYVLPSMIFIMSFSEYIKSERLKKIIFALLSFLLILFITFRSSSTEVFYGYDTNEYIRVYNNSYYKFDSSLEVGYSFLNFILNRFTDNYRYLFLVISSLSMVILGKYIFKNTKNTFIAILAYTSIFLYIRDLSQIRAALAYSICVYAVWHLVNKKTRLFMFYIFIATTIHASAIFMFFMYPISKVNFDKKHLYIILIVAIIITKVDWMGSIVNFVSKFSENDYIRSFIIYTSYYEPRGLDSKFLLYIAIAFIGVFIKDNQNIKSRIYDINIYMLVFGIFIAGLFNGSEVISIRLSELYITSMIIVISRFKDITNNRYLEVVLHILVCLFLIAYSIAFINSVSRYGAVY